MRQFLAGLFMAMFALGPNVAMADCINADLQLAVGDALQIAKLQGGRANVRYISMYAIPPLDQPRYAAAISVLCHQLSHAGIVIHPKQINEQVLRLELDAYDPHGVGWAKGWELIVAHDTRWHSGQVVPVGAGVFRGAKVEVLCADDRYYPAEVLEVVDGNVKLLMGGKSYQSRKFTFRQHHHGAYGEWVDLASAKLLEEITGSKGAILEARDVAYYICRDANIYYMFRNAPKTLREWRELGGEVGATTSFGQFGIRGANLNQSGVTHRVRGLERGKLGLWLSYDIFRDADLTDDRNPFKFPERTHKSDAYEGLRITANGGMDCFIANGQQQRVDAVPGNIAQDTSYGVRELRPPLSCWSCHTKKEGAVEANGFRSFEDRQSQRATVAKDPLLAAQLAAYYNDQDKLSRDMDRDREDFAEGIRGATETGIGDALPPSEAFEILNRMVAEVSDDLVGPEAALVEWCVTIKDGEKAQDVLARYLSGTTNDALVDLMNGLEVQAESFRAATPEALYRIHVKRQFLRE